MRFGLLGPLAVSDGERPVRLTGTKQHALLALLALNAGRPVPADRLIDGVWGDEGPRDLANALQHQISRLRAALGGDHVARRDPGYVLEVPPDAVDVRRFERLAGEGRAALRRDDPGEAATRLRAALALWRGAALEGLPGHAWVQAEAARLEGLRLDTVEDRVDAELALGRHDQLVAELESLAGEHPFRERLWGQLMLAQYRCGRQIDALETFQRVRRLLAGEHGLEPGPQLRQLQSDILAHALPAPVVEEPPRPHVTGNLPAPLTSFIGRRDELVDLRGRARESRLLTLTGPPGVGKTRLAIEVAAAESGEFPDGTWLVELAPLTDAGTVAHAVASTLGVRDSDEDLLTYLRDRHLLLVLDNCEHLLPGVALLVDRMLAACPTVHALATSREPLGIGGEAQWHVGPLSLPGAEIRDPRELLGSEAVRLFEDRAVDVLPSFVITPETAPVIGALCRRLDGLPLAIELAAARVRALPVGHIAAALEDRFRFLVNRSRTAPPHRQTLRAALDWSYDLLEPAERAVFPRLSVFAGSFSLAAAAAVCHGLDGRDELVDLVTGLVDKSLLTTEPDPDGLPRFRMLETIREYGGERLADQDGARRAHREFYTGLAEAAEAGVRRRDYRAWHRRIAADYDNLRAASENAPADGEVVAALRIGAALWLFWGAADRHDEGRAWLETALAAAEAAAEQVPAGIRAAGYTTLSYLAGQRDDVDRAIRAGERAIALAGEAGDAWETARAKQTLALVLGAAGEPERAATLLAEARVTMVATDDDFWVCGSDLIAATGAVRAGRLDVVRQRGAEILVRARRAGYEPFESWARLLLAAAAERRGDLTTAAGELTEALDLSGRLGLPHYAAFVRTELGRLATLDDDLPRARALLTEAVTAAETGDSPWHAALARCGLAETLRLSGEEAAAEAILRTVRAWGESPDTRRTRATFFTALAGSPYARSLAGLGALAAARGDTRTAEPLLLDAFARADRSQDHATAATALEALAATAEPEPAALLLGAAGAHRAATAHPLRGARRGDVDRLIAKVRAGLGDAATETALSTGRRLSPRDAIARTRR
ncbi:BTAD domain-containing putative transcriptional regulator [Paractinoplanes globisporus]|uniref:BTAD domain-containing putative transcriptional regulator n=1 Tax=Paractinoplanes globisporus TaxID=113565 RepID=A0ABW6WCR1_9ACTN|nr:BTAD domain-containing putative transcriptional regulator [Actinoplanes globisporus]